MLAATVPYGCNKVLVVDCDIAVAILLVTHVSTMIDHNKVWKMDLEHALIIHSRSQWKHQFVDMIFFPREYSSHDPFFLLTSLSHCKTTRSEKATLGGCWPKVI